ncbi:MAG: glutamine amidotransferase [Hahellaceae bacterium]|jgi:GMP synthase (glutamine-hydrolysing)|nr:glutamine amidotransferase [Hahellaceae bacterium]
MSNPSPILVIQCGNTFPDIYQAFGDFDQWFLNVVESVGGKALVFNAHTDSDCPDFGRFSGVLITGSPAMVTDRAPWSEHLAQQLRAPIDQGLPVLGVCYGHQLLAHALGGLVDYQNGGREIGSLRVTLAPAAATDALFGHVKGDFYAHLTHSQSVVELPPGAALLASSSRVPVQAVYFKNRCWGVQFHPEFDEAIMARYLEAFNADIPVSLRNHLGPHPCPVAREILTRFVTGCLTGGLG